MKEGPATRDLVLGLVEREPGIHKSALKRELGLGWGTISYHLEMLRRRGAIKMRAQGRQVGVFPSRVPDGHMPWLAALREAVPQGILTRLAERPEARIDELSEDLGLSRRIVRRHLTDLTAQGLVRGPLGVSRNRFRLGEGDALVASLKDLPK
ncbi:MAG: ArsR family transcriptional regulator [Thermoplasmatota archaeon]